MRIPPTCFAAFSIHFSINCKKNEVRKVQFRADEQRKSIKRLRQQTRLVQYTFSTVVVAAACCCCCCYWNALKNTSNKCYSSLANQIAWCANIFVCLTKVKVFYIYANIVCVFYVQFFIFLFWFSCFLLLNLFSVCDSSLMCHICAHSCFHWVGFFIYLSLTLICLYMVMSKAEGARCGRPMSAVSLSIQLFWSPRL